MFPSSHAPSFPICHYHILHPFLLCFCVHILVQMTDAEIVSSSFVSGDPPNSGFDDTGNPLTPVFEEMSDTNFEILANEEDQLQEREAAEREADERTAGDEEAEQKANAAPAQSSTAYPAAHRSVESFPVAVVGPGAVIPYRRDMLPPGTTSDRLLEIRGTGGKGKGARSSNVGGVELRQVAADRSDAYFFEGGWPTKDLRNVQVHCYILARLRNGQSGIVTTVRNVCINYGTIEGCQNQMCGRYHTSELGQLMDRLPCAPNGPPVLVGLLPDYVKSNRLFMPPRKDGPAVNLLTWAKEDKLRVEAANHAASAKRKKALRKLEEERKARADAIALSIALAEAKEAHAHSLHQRDQAMLGHSSSSFSLVAPPAPMLPITSPAAPTTSAPTQVPGRAGQMGKRAAEAEEDAEEAELELEAVQARLRAVQARKRARLAKEAEE